ncbi:iron complex outermembrane receptor protein [Pedobacter cryoconitis]|uniref:TonB-dependent receptor n=1 Tax=Pedobacter cryoconitis TaxID=188932 RepID=UPI001619D215|nr:TonB-dependent receptor [Pedobacter cryoconitis]MBB6270761.1 iron complex outermembrane receptor protein [Pedobacter cryoconitis]
MNLKISSALLSCLTISIITFFTTFNTVRAQTHPETVISISPKILKLRDVFDQLSEKAGLNFIYSNIDKELEKTITIYPSSAPVKDILEQLSLKSGLKFSANGDDIAVKHQAKGNIRGTVKTTDKEPVAFVTVRLKGLKSTETNEDGEFEFKNIPAGEVTISVSHIGRSAQSRKAIVKADEYISVDFMVSSSATDLQEVAVNGNRANKFAEKKSDYVAKLPLKNLENAQVYNTVSNRLMKEQLSVNVLQALSNIPGAVPSTSARGETQITLRGFIAVLGARNGIQYVAAGRTSVDPINIERIEVLKGPSATLFGNAVSSYGGAINLVTKKPFETAAAELSYSIGSWGLSRITADVNTPLNEDKTALLRVNAAINKQESFLETGHNNTFAIDPSLTYRVNDRLTLAMDIEATREDVTRPGSLNFDVLKLKNVNQIPLDYKQTLFADDFNAIANTFRTYFEARYQLSKEWASYTNLSVNNERLEKSYQNESVFISADSIKRAIRVFGPFNTTNTNIQHNLKGDFKIGSIRNRFIWGVDYTREIQSRYTARATIDYISIKEPILHVSRAQADKVLGLAYGYTYQVNRYATYVSDLVNLTDRLMVLLSLRADRYQRKTSDGGTENYSQTSFTPKLGLIYQPVKDQVSLFANYMSGFTNMAPVSQPDGTTLALKPEYGIQWESGVKINTKDNKYTATLSYYNINVRDAVRMDASQYTFQDGKQKSKGFDLSFVANPIPGLNMIVGYAFNENHYIQSASGIGKEVIANPKNVANFWLGYKFQPGTALTNFGLGFGGNYVDKSFHNTDNTVIIPSYTLLNATAFYEQQKWRFGLACNNLANQKYWSYENPQPLRQLILSTSFRF